MAKVTPEVLATTYDITGAPTPSGSDKNHQAVAEFQGQTMKEKDLEEFFRKYVKDAKAGDDKVAKFVGDKNKNEPEAEASLDIQYIMGNNAGLKTEFWLFNPMDFCGDLEKWTALILETKEAPLVHSVSYGWQGELAQIQCSEAKYKVVDANFAKLAAMGITIIFASGDSGSGYDPTSSSECEESKFKKGKAFNGTVLKEVKFQYDAGECCDSAGTHKGAKGWTFKKKDKGRKPGECTLYHEITHTTDEPGAQSAHLTGAKLYPSWPASSPWVTSVGATRFVGQKVGNEQMASDQFGSGGGFSTMFNRSLASWQESVVTTYLADAPGLPPKGSFPPGGRATPDVSALGEGYMTIIGGTAQPIGGAMVHSVILTDQAGILPT